MSNGRGLGALGLDMQQKVVQTLVDLPLEVANTIRRYQEGQKSGQVTLHFREGRVVEVDELVKGRIVTTV